MPNPFPLGRHEAPDKKDRQFPLLAAMTSVIKWRERPWKVGSVLDQGARENLCPGCTRKEYPHQPYCCEQGYCVGYGWRSFVDAQPLMTTGGPLPLEIYHEAQKRDEWFGQEYAGTSVRAGVKYLQEKGHIAEYLWAFDAATVAEFVRTRGTVVLGVSWFSNMFWPAAEHGFLLDVSGPEAGGHCIHCVWYYKRKVVNGVALKNVFVLKNSWGSSWANNGFCYIKFDDLDMLIKAGGEAVAAVEKKYVKV